MATIEEKIKALQEKLKQEKAKKQKMEARKKSAEIKNIRASDTRKKILIGAYVMDQMNARGEPMDRLNINGLLLSDWLKRDDDRTLFGLSVLPKSIDGNQKDV